MGSIRLASLFLTLPTLALTGQQVISSDGNDTSRAFRSDGPAGSSPSLLPARRLFLWSSELVSLAVRNPGWQWSQVALSPRVP
jgi:hypothetical protein